MEFGAGHLNDIRLKTQLLNNMELNKQHKLIEIDGSQGEGGGQVLRTSLTLSLCLGVPVRVFNIRAGRTKPGLLRQHLTCLRAAESISHGNSEGAELRSNEIIFYPGKVASGNYRFNIGSAGGTTLVFQTIYIPLLLAGGESKIYFEGGTHNGMSPSFDYITQCFLPVMKKIGAKSTARLDHYGFYPAGGGAWQVKIEGLKHAFKRINLTERGETVELKATATSSKLSSHVTERELGKFKQLLKLHSGQLEQRLVRSVGPGNIVSLLHQYENGCEVVEVVGEKNVSAEKVAQSAIEVFERFNRSKAVVGEHLADQLILPMVLGEGGKFTTIEPSMHLLTNIEVVKQFLPVDIQCKKISDDFYEVKIGN